MKKSVTIKWYRTDGDVFGLMHDGKYHKFESDTEYITNFREEEQEMDSSISE